MPSLFSSFCQSKASFILTQSCLHPAKDQHAAAEMSKSMGRILTAKKKRKQKRCMKCRLTVGLRSLAWGHLSADGPGEKLWAITTSWSASSYVLTHNLFSSKTFWGVFIYSTSCLSHPGVNLQIRHLPQNYVAASHRIFHFFSPARVCFGMLWTHANNPGS